MSARSGKVAGLRAALRGLLLMRVMELRSKGAAIRIGLSFLIAFGLTWLVVDRGSSEGFWWASLTVFALKFLPVYCLTKGGETLRSELKDGTIEYLWTRSVGKPKLYLAFYASTLVNVLPVVLAILIALTLGSLALGTGVGILDLALFWLLAICGTVAFTAVGSAMGAYSSKFVVLGIFYFSFVELGLGQLPTGVRNLAVSAHVKDALEATIDGRLSGPFSALAGSALSIFVIGAVGLLLGTLIFTSASYNVGGEKEG